VLAVVRRSVGLPGDALFRPGDLLLSLDDEPVTRFRDLRRISRGGRFVLGILRGGGEQTVEVVPEVMDGGGTTRAVLWAGALLQAPHPALASQRHIAAEGVYVSRHWYGSPSTRYGLDATSRIVEVDGRPVHDLDEFLEAVAGKQDRDAVRLEILDLDGRPDVITLKVDLEYWPTYELRKTGGVWERAAILEQDDGSRLARNAQRRPGIGGE
jgi:S1-C subfamily serine protease